MTMFPPCLSFLLSSCIVIICCKVNLYSGACLCMCDVFPANPGIHVASFLGLNQTLALTSCLELSSASCPFSAVSCSSRISRIYSPLIVFKDRYIDIFCPLFVRLKRSPPGLSIRILVSWQTTLKAVNQHRFQIHPSKPFTASFFPDHSPVFEKSSAISAGRGFPGTTPTLGPPQQEPRSHNCIGHINTMEDPDTSITFAGIHVRITQVIMRFLLIPTDRGLVLMVPAVQPLETVTSSSILGLATSFQILVMLQLSYAKLKWRG